MMSARNARASRRSRIMTGDNPMYPPAIELVYPKAPRARRGTVAAKKAKLAAFKQAMATQKRTGRSMRSFRPLSASTEAYVTRKRDAARKRYAGRTDVIGKQMARAAAREAKFAEASAKRAARALKRRRAAARGPIDVMTMSPGTIAAIMGRRQKAGVAALARRMRDPAFAARYKQKMLGRKYRQGGRLLGATYKAPVEKRKTTRVQRKQGGIGLRKGDMAGLLGMDTSLMRMGDYGSRASLMDYADLMRRKAREAYVRRKRRMDLDSFVRTPATASRKKAKRAAAYRRRKAAAQQALNSASSSGSNSNGSTNMQPVQPRRVTRASAMAQQRVASARAAAAKSRARASVPASNRRTRSMAPLRRSTRLAGL